MSNSVELKNFQKRINYQGNLVTLLEQITKDYDIGDYQLHNVIEMGYEDFNVILETTNGKYFIKIFANFRNAKEAKRYTDLMLAVLNAGVNHPKLYKSNQGYLHTIDTKAGEVYLVVMEYIDGQSFYEAKLNATIADMRYLINQAAIINTINSKPPYIHDDWAIVNFIEQYNLKQQFLTTEDDNLIKPLVIKFEKIQVGNLPKCLVHGDIIKTNVMKTTKGDLYILDFSVANYYPRIQELAVLLCNLLFDENNPNTFPDIYNLALNEYGKYIKLSQVELDALPTYIQIAHAMHIIGPIQFKVEEGIETDENNYWLSLGRKGLKFTSTYWN